jgi:hypothetical protein
LWFNSANATTYIYYDSFWVELSEAKLGPTGATGPTGETGATGAAGNDGALSPNAIINGAFDIWQRGTSFTTAGAFNSDRWQTGWNGTGTITVSRQAFTPGAAPLAGNEGQFFLRAAQSVAGTGQTFFNVAETKIEDVRTFTGQTVTLSFFAKADSNRALNSVLYHGFGSGGSSAVFFGSVTHNLTTSWQRFTATVVVPSISGKTIGANNFLALALASSTLNATQTVDIWGVQLEAGSVATPFKRNANSIQGELAACQRYCKVFTGGETDLIGFAFSTTGGQYYMKLPTTMRSAPSLATVTASNFTVFNSGFSSGTPTAVTLNSSNTESVTLNTTTNSGSPTLAQNQPAKLIGGSSALIILSSEL